MITKTSYPTAQEAVTAAASALTKLIAENSDKKILLLLSGGSSLASLEEVDTEKFGDHITISVLDERYTENPADNNFAYIAGTKFYKNAKNAGCHFIDTRIQENESQREMADRFNFALKQWRAENPFGKIIITQGVGSDGHTSGMMPFPENETKFAEYFENEKRWAEAYDAAQKNEFPLRVTTTNPFLREVDHSILFASGETKSIALKRVLEEGGEISETPAKIIFDMKDVQIFTDFNI